jgi:uncharacterized membrane protein
MAKDMSDTVRDALGQVVREAVKNVGSPQPQKKSSPFSGARGLAAGAGLAALAPLAKKGVDAVRGNGISLPSPKPGKMATKATTKAAKKMGDSVGGKLKEGVSEKVDEAGGAGGLVKEAASGILPGGGGDSGGGKGGMPGVGKGRRMPVQQSVDVAVPVETAYNQFTQFEDWPEFMHRVTSVTQEDDCTVSFATKIWTRKREFKAEIETQRPDERIKWKVSQGITHTGVVTFHELAPRLTRVELNMDVDPGSLIEKAARGMRHVKRAARADLHRFKAFIEMQEIETGAWRGVIEDGELVEEHPEDYDEEREYSDVEDAADQSEDEDQDEDRDEEGDEEEEDQRSRSERFKRQAERSSSGSGGGGSSRSRSGSSSRGGGGNASKSSGRSQASSRSRSQSRSRGSSNGGGDSSSKSSKKSGSSSSGGRRKTSNRG